VMTFSAGALLVPELMRKDRDQIIHRVVMMYPLLGVVAGSPSANVVSEDVAQRLDFASGISSLAQRKTPVTMIRAGSDAVFGLLALLDAGVSKALRANLDLELINLPSAPHGFDASQDLPPNHRAIARVIAITKE
jgi:hypothetical protein